VCSVKRSTQLIVCFSILVAALCARADVAPPSESLDVHSAARKLAQKYKVSVVVCGGSSAPVKLTSEAKDAQSALTELAAASGLALKKKADFWVLVPASDLGKVEGPRRPLPPGTRVNFDLQRVEADTLLGVIAEVMKLKLDGHVGGKLTVVGQDFASLTLLGVVTRLAGHEASRHSGRLIVSGELPGRE